jgi:hypothetical protein
MKQEQVKKGMDIISLGIGDPDLPTPPHIIQALAQTAADPKNHQYPSYEGMLGFRKAAADWYGQRFGATLDPATEVLALIGSKEGIGHLPLAFINPGDVVLVPDPAYPVYKAGTLFAGGESYFMPLTTERNFLPDLGAIPAAVLRRAKILWLNYPNNPTGAGGAARVPGGSGGLRPATPADPGPRRAVFRDRVRRVPTREYSERRRSQGGRGRIPLGLQDLQHDRVAAGVRRGQRRNLGGPRAGETEPRLRRLPGCAVCRNRRADRLPAMRGRQLPDLAGARDS